MAKKLTIIGIVIIVILLIVGSLFVVLQDILPIEFAGLTWTDSGDIRTSSCDAQFHREYGCSVNGGVTREGEFLVITFQSSQASGQRYIETDMTYIDEILIIYDGYAEGNTWTQGSTGSGSIFASIVGTESGSIGHSASQSGDRNTGVVTRYFEPSVWKLKNNFDGTWSALQSLGIGDIFIVKSTQTITGTPKLRIGVSTSASAQFLYGKSWIRIYNVVIKSNAFAVCKADEWWRDTNQDGIPQPEECADLDTIVLNHEEAFFESFNEKLDRITAELEAKNTGLTAEIEALKQRLANQSVSDELTDLQEQIALLEAQLPTAEDKQAIQQQIDELREQQLDSENLQDRIDTLTNELETTKQLLDEVKAENKQIIAVIEANEKFTGIEVTNFIYIIIGLLSVIIILLMTILLIKKKR